MVNRIDSRLPLLASEPPELLVHDEPLECPYLPDRVARLPLRLPVARLSRAQLDQRLAQGERRQGRMVYRPACDPCAACEAIRIAVRDFTPNKTQRRVQSRGRQRIETSTGPVTTSAERVALYNRHKQLRGLALDDRPLGLEGYAAMLADTCCESFELRYHIDAQLIGVAIVDRAERSLSAVYCYYDPGHGALSPGVYSILSQIELCRRWGLDYLYLGLTVDGCRAMTYKTTYRPHERLVAGRWIAGRG
jgi:arginine-tRNA-protein transferase